MPTIVEYSGRKAAQNLYPSRIISPPRASRCCFSDMEEVGAPESDGQWVFRYKRCRTCGFSVRIIIGMVPDEQLIAELRETFRRWNRKW